MSMRRIVILSAVTAIAAATMPFIGGAGATTAVVYPKAGCFDQTDPSGDAHPDLQPQIPTDKDLDILGVAFQSTATDFRAFIKVNDLLDGPSSTDGHRYTVTFVFGNHLFSLAGSSFSHGTGTVRESLASTGKAGHLVQLGIDTPAISPANAEQLAVGDRGYKTSGLSFTWDTTGNWVIVTLPIADIQKYGGAKFTGKLQSIAAFSATDEYAVSSSADTSEPNNGTTYTGVWTIGSNKCWPKPKPKPAPKKKH